MRSTQEPRISGLKRVFVQIHCDTETNMKDEEWAESVKGMKTVVVEVGGHPDFILTLRMVPETPLGTTKAQVRILYKLLMFASNSSVPQTSL